MGSPLGGDLGVRCEKWGFFEEKGNSFKTAFSGDFVRGAIANHQTPGGFIGIITEIVGTTRCIQHIGVAISIVRDGLVRRDALYCVVNLQGVHHGNIFGAVIQGKLKRGIPFLWNINDEPGNIRSIGSSRGINFQSGQRICFTIVKRAGTHGHHHGRFRRSVGFHQKGL